MMIAAPREAHPYSWEEMVQANHHRWSLHTGPVIKAAEARALNADTGDVLDDLVAMQMERQKRLVSLLNPPAVVDRLYRGLPAPLPPPSDPLADFVAFAQHKAAAANANGAQTKAFQRDYWGAEGRYRGKAEQAKPAYGMHTKMGLHYAQP